MDDFGPLSVVQQVEQLKKLYEVRQRLSDLLTKLDGNDKLDTLLTQRGTRHRRSQEGQSRTR